MTMTLTVTDDNDDGDDDDDYDKVLGCLVACLLAWLVDS